MESFQIYGNTMTDFKVRHSESKDIPAIKALYEQPSCYASTLQQPFASEQLWQDRLNRVSDHFTSLVAESHGELLGQLNIEVFKCPRRKHAANIGMAVSEAHRGQGVGRALLEAVIETVEKWQAVTRIELEVYTDNKAAIELYQECGFTIEGTAKNYAFRNGEFVDVYLMARLKK